MALLDGPSGRWDQFPAAEGLAFFPPRILLLAPTGKAAARLIVGAAPPNTRPAGHAAAPADIIGATPAVDASSYQCSGILRPRILGAPGWVAGPTGCPNQASCCSS